MTHTLTAHLLGGYLNTALIADRTALAAEAYVGIFILAARASAILGRTKDALAEEAADLGLQRTVVDCFGLGNLTVGPGTDHFGRGKTNFDRVKFFISHYRSLLS